MYMTVDRRFSFISDFLAINLGSDYFTENFQVKENKTKMRNIHPQFFHSLFYGLKLGFRLEFGLGFDLGIVLEQAYEFGLYLRQN